VSQFISTPLDERPNQSPSFQDIDLFSIDIPLMEATKRAGLDAGELSRFGREWGAAEMLEHGRLANENPPRFRPFDAKGNRIDLVEYHPSYHALMEKSVASGLQAPASSDARMPNTERAARFYVANQVEAGHICPITMTHASVAALRAAPVLYEQWAPKISSRIYDRANKPWRQKTGVTIGMGMTERQGGTDVQTNTTRAFRTDDHVEITGQKWFLSAPMCDAFLVLAQAEEGLSCYLMPRFRPDGSLNGMHLQRLKEKLGNRSNASSEVEFDRAFAWPVGPPGAGVKTIIEMVQLTRLDCAIASAGLMRMGLAQAVHHVRHRRAFGKRLVDQPAMRATLADMALEMEGMVALVFRLALAFDQALNNAEEAAAYARLLTPAAKYLVCKTAPAFLYEAMECLGGNGYVEELTLARLYREAPVNAIWEGSGNVVALDVLRAASRSADVAIGVVERLSSAVAQILDAKMLLGSLSDALRSDARESYARFTCERLARVAALAALCEIDSPFAAAYASKWLGGAPFATYGCHDLRLVEESLLERTLPF
jgi:putative acyl-CoA dehydrogenase